MTDEFPKNYRKSLFTKNNSSKQVMNKKDDAKTEIVNDNSDYMIHNVLKNNKKSLFSNNNTTEPKNNIVKKINKLTTDHKITNCCDFDSQVAYIVKNIGNEPIEEISIQEYLENKVLMKEIHDKKKFLVCSNNNELIKYESEKIQCHFKHKNNYYNEMCEWHKNWQNCFDDTEIKIGTRIADAIVDDTVIEFQHSRIPKDIVNKRNNNYSKHNKKICWVIDCNDNVEIDELTIHNTYLIKFKHDYWKYQHFINNDYIYLDVRDKIFRIKPSDVKSHMIDVNEFKTKQTFINCLKNNENNWNESKLPQCVLYHNQLGAGCGKTYDSIQLLNSSEKFKHKTLFIYLTMQHSAKEVIYGELKDQFNAGQLTSLKIDTNSDDDYENDNNDEIGTKKGKQYVINYINTSTNKECKIIIGTIDSFMWTLGDKSASARGNDFFYELVKSIRDKSGKLFKSKNCNIRYAGDTHELNKQSLIIIDEAQDLRPTYIEAICRIMRDTYMDAYVIGDKLQSIWTEVNIHTYLEENELPNIVIKKNDKGKNHVRRFHNHKLQEFVNNTVDFKKFKLPAIEKICDTPDCKYKHEDKNCVQIFSTQPTYSIGYKNLNKTVDTIINYMNDEVEQYNYVPSNFMFIFPMIKNNPLANMLESRIQKFWIEKFADDEYRDLVLNSNTTLQNKISNISYNKYVFLHKSEEGKSINLEESEHATRILSIHASKGSGREVVFLCNLSESALQKFSKKTGNLVYESLLHVALTRQKKSLYIALEFNSDDVYMRISDNKNKPIIKMADEFGEADLYCIRETIKYKKIIESSLSDDEHFNKIVNNHTEVNIAERKKDDNAIIDWGHHVIRYCVFLYYIKYFITNNEKIDDGHDQTKTILKKLANCEIELFHYNDYYKRIIEKTWVAHKIFPVLLQDKDTHSIYRKYCNIVVKFIKKIQTKINNSMENDKLPQLCPMEATILEHMIHTFIDHKYSDITIMDVYSVMYCYDECSGALSENHDYDCLCKQYFTAGNGNKDSFKYKEIRESIMNHYEKINHIELLYKNYINLRSKYCGDDTNFTYNVQHMIYLKGKQYKIFTKCEIIAFSPNYVIYFVLKPQYNLLNKYDVIFDSMFHNYIIMNTSETVENYNRYNDKKIITCILTLDSKEPYFYAFDIDIDIFKNCIKDYIFKEYSKYSEYFHNFFKYCCENNDTGKTNIDYICNKLSGYCDLPKYITDFFNEKQQKIEKYTKKRDKDKIMKTYNEIMDKSLFIKSINDYLEKNINDYLDICINIDDNNFQLDLEKDIFSQLKSDDNNNTSQNKEIINDNVDLDRSKSDKVVNNTDILSQKELLNNINVVQTNITDDNMYDEISIPKKSLFNSKCLKVQKNINSNSNNDTITSSKKSIKNNDESKDKKCKIVKKVIKEMK